jgi:uncharacterized membrane protein
MGRRRNFSKRSRGGAGLIESAALIGTGAYLARQNPDSNVLGVMGTAAKYFGYFLLGLLIFFIVLFSLLFMFGKPSEPPPPDTTNSASGN